MTKIVELKAAKEKKKSRGRFFAVDYQQWQKVCALGMNQAVAYLVLANGASGKDHSTTKWSARSISKYSKLPFERGRRAIADLVSKQFVERLEGGDRPKYRIVISSASDQKKLIWLPNAIVTGVENLRSPLHQILQTDNVLTLQVLVNLYFHHHLESEAGISQDQLSRVHTGEKVGDYKQFAVWEFVPACDKTACGWNLAEPIFNPELLKKYRKTDKAKVKSEMWKPFWNCLQVIEDLRLIEWVPYLFSSNEGVPIHPYGVSNKKDSVSKLERALGDASHEAAVAALLCIKQRAGVDDETLAEFSVEADRGQSDYYRVIVPRHIQNLTMRSIARLSFRPITKPTSRWYAQLHATSESWVSDYGKIKEQAQRELVFNSTRTVAASVA